MSGRSRQSEEFTNHITIDSPIRRCLESTNDDWLMSRYLSPPSSSDGGFVALAGGLASSQGWWRSW